MGDGLMMGLSDDGDVAEIFSSWRSKRTAIVFS